MNPELLEKTILATILQDNFLLDSSGVHEAMFTSTKHRMLYRAMHRLNAERQPIDVVTLLSGGEAAEIGGANFIASLHNYAKPENIDQYCKILRDHWVQKEKHNLLVKAQAHDWTLDQIQQALHALEGESAPQQTNLADYLITMWNRPYEPQKDEQAIHIQLKTLAPLLPTFRRGELIILAGRPSMGKTDVMNHFALESGRQDALPLIFSLEMSRASLTDRLISATGKISRLKMRNPHQLFNDKQKQQWGTVLGELSNAHIQLDDRGGMTVAQIRAQARRMIHQFPDRQPIIFIDYLQIIYSDATYSNSNAAIGQISASLKLMAKELNCPVVCLAQLNRSVETRSVKRPFMSDLRDSGNIEQDADVIILLYRESYYEPNSAALAEVLELNVAKNRNGPTGTATVDYYKTTGRLQDPS